MVAAVVPSVSSQNRGSQGQCIGSSYHQVDYEHSDEKDENGMPTSFSIQVQPKPEESFLNCLPTNGGTDKAVCVGMNTNDCNTAAQVVKINDILDCEECFMGLTTDLFYNLTVDKLSLKNVQVGIRDSHLRGKSVLHLDKGGSQSAGGSFPIVKNGINGEIKFSAGPVPVSIKYKVPMQLDYVVDVKESVDFHFGGAVDVNLGDHYLSWTSEDGFATTSSQVGVTWTPTIVADGSVTADVPLTIQSSLEMELENVLSWNVHLTPALSPLRASLKDHLFSSPSVCLSGDGDFLVNHDADVHFNFAGFHHTFAQFGPAQIYHKHWNSLFDKCISPGAEEDVVV